WLDAGGTVGELLKLVNAAPPYVPVFERGHLPGDPEPEEPTPGNPLITGAMNNTSFATATFPREWVIEDMLVENEPAVGAGPSKTMKTGIGAVDAAVSVASGKPFLGRFKVPKARPVYVISAESGAANLPGRTREGANE